MPQRIQLRRTKGWRKPEGCIVVARPGYWGNPYRLVGGCSRVACDRPPKHWHVYEYDQPLELSPVDQAEAAAWAVFYFAALVKATGWEGEIRAKLRGRDLACWCKIGQPCHADVLLEIANAGDFGDGQQ